LRKHFDPYLYEEDRARGKSPRDHCRKMIGDSEVFVGIVGSRYGSRVGEDDDRSICEWEFDVARRCKDTEVMMMVSQAHKGTEIEPEQRRFRERIAAFGSGVWCGFFSSTQQLLESVAQALTTWLAECFCESRDRRARRRQWALAVAVSVAVFAVLMVIGAVAANIFWAWFTGAQLVGICGVSIAMILLGFLLITAAK
jgi:hypothetical protein